ncbi:MAG: hypothetical protein H6563_05980 [Lewinellaceae bacterium]|nr:hypothetical protein [Lewinellaceae bacterium]
MASNSLVPLYTTTHSRTRAQESSAAIQRLYIAMRHLFIRGSYKPLGVSGEAMIEALMTLRPEIYGSIADPEKVELEGLLYIFQRLPEGIEECRYINLISREGLEYSHFPVIIPPKRRRNCYRIDAEQMFIEMTRGRSDIYDVLTHLTFLFIESEKIRRNSESPRGAVTRAWKMLEQIVAKDENGEDFEKEVAYTYLSSILGRPFGEIAEAAEQFEKTPRIKSLFHITYWMGKLAREEKRDNKDRIINFSSALREKVGHHLYGELWANHIKQHLLENQLFDRPLHIISSNLHSVMNSFYAPAALKRIRKTDDLSTLAMELSKEESDLLRNRVVEFAEKNGMVHIEDESGTNISIQLFDLTQIPASILPPELEWNAAHIAEEQPLLLVMDYAFGEQAYEIMDELLKPYELPDHTYCLKVSSISVMGKAGILEGKKGDIMIPTAHVFEGTADNYPLDNDLKKEDFEGHDLAVYQGPMISVLGTSLQNKDILQFFLDSSWKAVGLEMEGAHYQKAIQAASKIRNNIQQNVILRYAYYASDNPLITGHTLASGSLGEEGVKPTYLITWKILNKILNPAEK